MYSTLFKDELTTKRKYFHYVVAIFGSLCGLVSFIISFIDLIKAFAETEEGEGLQQAEQIASKGTL